jgi:hypothetical protein
VPEYYYADHFGHMSCLGKLENCHLGSNPIRGRLICLCCPVYMWMTCDGLIPHPRCRTDYVLNYKTNISQGPTEGCGNIDENLHGNYYLPVFRAG